VRSFNGHAGIFPGIPSAGENAGGIAEAGDVHGHRARVRADGRSNNDERLAGGERALISSSRSWIKVSQPFGWQMLIAPGVAEFIEKRRPGIEDHGLAGLLEREEILQEIEVTFPRLSIRGGLFL
jgi:hypothetical protein